jgi:hypothetical protein
VIFGQNRKQKADSEQRALLRAQAELEQSALQQQYEEVCKSYHAIDDFRAKLLALLPIGGGAVGVGLVVGKTTGPEYLLPLGVFGIFVTVGLGFYEMHQSRRCGLLKCRAKELESRLGLKGQGVFWLDYRKDYGVFSQGVAGAIVYATAAAGWLYLLAIGIVQLIER